MFLVRNFPLMIIPLVLYNLYSFNLLSVGEADWAADFASFQMISDTTFTLSHGGLVITVALALLFFEILKATRTAQSTIVDHLLSTVVFIVYLIQFIVDPAAATTTFFICTIIAALDVVAGYSISIRVASRDVTFDRAL